MKRVNLTLPESVYYELERLAEVEARPIANMAFYIVIQALNKAKKDGLIEPYVEEPKPKKLSKN